VRRFRFGFCLKTPVFSPIIQAKVADAPWSAGIQKVKKVDLQNNLDVVSGLESFIHLLTFSPNHLTNSILFVSEKSHIEYPPKRTISNL